MAIDYSETRDLDAVYQAIGKRVVRLARSGEILEFAVKTKPASTSSGKKSKNCTKGYSCGYSCVSKTKNCRSPLTGQGKNYADWLAKQIQAGIALHPNHQADAQKMGLVAGTAPASTKGTKLPKTPKTPKTPKATTPAPAPAPAANPIKLNQKELDDKRNELVQKFGKQIVEDAEKNVKRILNDADTNVYIRVGSSDTLAKILGDRFRTAHELGITNHQIPDLPDTNYLTARARVEAKTLGYGKNTPDADRPIYGYLGGKNLQGDSHGDVAEAYGSIAIKLKPEVKDRASFTGADSFKSGIASDLKNPNAASLASVTRFGYDLNDPNVPSYLRSRGNFAQGGQLQDAATARTIDDLNKLAPTGKKYIEAQIHGKVTADDIAEIHFSPKSSADRPTPAIAQLAKDKGIPLYVNGQKIDPDDILNPAPPKNKVAEMNDAINAGDFGKFIKLAKEIDARAATMTLAPGERDLQLKALYAESGFDGLPKVGTEADVTNTWKAGGALMVRGVEAASGDRTKYLKQFQTGDYFVGNGMYGNGTYVGHAGTIKNGQYIAYTPATAASDAKRAVDDVAKHAYINRSSVVFRMALDPQAKIALQTDLEADIKKVRADFRSWYTQEVSRIKASANSPDANKYKAALAKATASNSALMTAKPVKSGSRVLNGGLQETISYSVKNGSKSVNFTVVKEEDVSASLGSSRKSYRYRYQDADGNWQTTRSAKAAISAAQTVAVEAQNVQDALKATGLKSVPLTNVAPALAALKKDADDMAKLLGLGAQDSGALGRFAVVRGWDAIALNDSYEPKTFMNLLNRSKVVIQQNELPASKWTTTGAL